MPTKDRAKSKEGKLGKNASRESNEGAKKARTPQGTVQQSMDFPLRGVQAQTKKSKTRATKTRASAKGLTFPPVPPVTLQASAPRTIVSLTVAEGSNPQAQTIIYIHGIANKPPASILKCQWDTALFGTSLGDRSRMAYWVNREYYPTPLDETCAGTDVVRIDDDEVSTRTIMALANRRPLDEGQAVEAEIDAMSDNPAQQHWLRTLAVKMTTAETATVAAAGQAARAQENWGAAGVGAAEIGARILPLPAFLRRLITRKITRAFLRDVNDFFFLEERRRVMEQSLVDRLNAGGGPFVVIAHSQGSMIAYNVLRQLEKQSCDVRLFVTIGSPLGLTEVQDVLRRWTGTTRLPFPACVTRWVNVADRLDPVALDTTLAAEYTEGAAGRRIEDHSGLFLNLDSPRYPHSGTGYLRTRFVQQAVRETVSNAFAQAVGRTIITKDLVTDLENSRREERHPVLIQLAGLRNRQGQEAILARATLAEESVDDLNKEISGDKMNSAVSSGSRGGKRGAGRDAHRTIDQEAGLTGKTAARMDLTEARAAVTEAIKDMVLEYGEELGQAEIEPLKRYISAKLTRLEVERLRTQFADLKIERIWRDAVKRALIYRSSNTVQARPANLGYSALGKGVNWAVLDTGVRADHPHFATYRNVVAQWNCTRPGDPVEMRVNGDQAAEGVADSRALDGNGHGTHVAGIIAGQCEVPLSSGEPKTLLAGMAPRASLYSFKVLDNQGRGQDSWIIKALDFIGDLNEKAGELVIHGLNLSLGGSFDPTVYGCGHTPLCQELRRLWGQGVLVCLAAGNEGYAVLRGVEGEVASNLDLTIGDPANLEEAIAVGSVHKSNPYTYGVSYFSSRGPTADGRVKPDLVAPGEQILSAFNDYNPAVAEADRTAQDLYVEMSGTSMATPHVSGILAAFLSERQEFIGYPDRVKAILLDNCTDLKRDPYFQGQGLPNLIKMLANT
jgi:subtilisin family serine protease/pimeloyl-ACP methyl ester carboxylesterase